MKLIRKTILVSCVILGCTNRQPQVNQSEEPVRKDSCSGQLIADTIIYDVIIHNTNPDDLWTQETLQYLRHRALIDSIFNLVYQEKIIAYEYFEKRPLKIKEIKKLEEEPGFRRDNIGKIQFTERWYFNTANLQFRKEVISIVLGYELINSDGTLRGHKPVFKLNLKN
jgi:hypothetical protein